MLYTNCIHKLTVFAYAGGYCSIKAFSLIPQIVAFSNILFAFTAYSVLLVLTRHVFFICCAARAL